MDIFPCNICPGDICPYQQYLSSYLHDLNPILKVGSWGLFEHIPTVTITFVQATLVLATFVHIRNISAVTHPKFDQTLKVGSWDHPQEMPTVIYQGNICPSDICPY